MKFHKCHHTMHHRLEATKLIDSDISGCWLLWWTVRRSAFATAKIIYQPWHCNRQCWRYFFDPASVYHRGSPQRNAKKKNSWNNGGKRKMTPLEKLPKALEGPNNYVRRAKTIWRLHSLVFVLQLQQCTHTSNCVLKYSNWKICYDLWGPILNWPECSMTDCLSVGRRGFVSNFIW